MKEDLLKLIKITFVKLTLLNPSTFVSSATFYLTLRNSNYSSITDQSDKPRIVKIKKSESKNQKL